MTDTACLANARIVLPDGFVHGKLILSGDRIAEVVAGTDVPRGALDCEGDHLPPGMVEMHTDNLERHMQLRPGVHLTHDTAILAHDGELASCGITTAFDALRIGSLDDRAGNYRKYARGVASGILALRHRPAGGALLPRTPSGYLNQEEIHEVLNRDPPPCDRTPWRTIFTRVTFPTG